ncbi:MAG: 1-acyl-sn-glycerol-3-phosphate acyltransferase [Elusimicrobia bacterium]|nr:1-acyl-sn-glycerol-3-phosphate acyltransferase [Elusimicrobiota bacterium]
MSPEVSSRFYSACVRGLAWLVRRVWGIECQGLEHVPASGPVIVAVNHRSWVDPPLVAMALYPRRFPRFMAKRELFKIPLLRWLMRQGKTIAVDRARPDVAAVRAAAQVLERGGCLVVFPEGTRSRTGIPGRPKSGVGFLACHARAPVVPARVWNTERFPAPSALRIRFGPAFRYEGDAGRRSQREFSERVLKIIFSL